MPCLQETARKGEARLFAENRSRGAVTESPGDGRLPGRSYGSQPPRLDRERQDVIYDAWERTTARSRIALARKALAITPLCPDAYGILAEEARSIEEARDLYAKALKPESWR